MSSTTEGPAAAPLPRHSSKALPVTRVIGRERIADRDMLTVEEPLEIRLGYSTPIGREQKSISITMRTPGNDLELALGFLFTEGIIRSAEHVSYLAHCGPAVDDSGLRNAVRIELQPGVDVDLERLQRHFYTSSSCGVCGKTSLEALRMQTHDPIEGAALRVTADRLCALPDKLRERQDVFGATGGLHASALFDTGGEIQEVREDVGRHNALDKLIGLLLTRGELPLSHRGILVSGRASFELMQKAIMAGAAMLAAVGAPSSLAVDLAQEFGVTLVGFLRDGRFNIYSREERVV